MFTPESTHYYTFIHSTLRYEYYMIFKGCHIMKSAVSSKTFNYSAARDTGNNLQYQQRNGFNRLLDVLAKFLFSGVYSSSS